MNWLVVAYGIVWVVLFGYLVMILRKERKILDELESLKKRLEMNSTTKAG